MRLILLSTWKSSKSRVTKKRLSLVFLVLVVIFTLSCNSYHEKFSIDGDDTPVSEKVKKLLREPEDISFSDVQTLVLNSHCVSCHSSTRIKGNVDLTSYENLVSGVGFKRVVIPFDVKASSLFSTLISTGARHMPPLEKPQLIKEQKDLIHVWISNGAKHYSSSVVQRLPSLKEILQPYFDKPETIDHLVVEEQIFKDNCFKCHSANSELAEEDVLIYSADLTSYETMFSSFEPVVVKGRPDKSFIYRAVAIEQTMPPAKDGYDPLDSLLVKLMRLWILNCAIKAYSSGETGLVSNSKAPDKVRLCEGQ